jgi:hypothetical protein
VETLVQLADQGRIHGEAIGLLALLKSPDKGCSQNLFRFDLIARHVEREGKSTMTVTFIDIPLLLLAGLLGSLGDNEIRFTGKLTFKFEQSYTDLKQLREKLENSMTR